MYLQLEKRTVRQIIRYIDSKDGELFVRPYTDSNGKELSLIGPLLTVVVGILHAYTDNKIR